MLGLAQLEEALGEANKAIDHFQKILSIDPNNIPVLNALANNQSKSSHWNEAIQNYNKGLKVISENLPNFKGKKGQIMEVMSSNIYNNMANTFRYQKKYDMAITHYEKAIQHNE